MRVKYSPIRSNISVDYAIRSDKVTARINGVTDTFDFSEFIDGKADNIETSLPINPVISAERKQGVLYVELLKPIAADATVDEKFPKWQEVK